MAFKIAYLQIYYIGKTGRIQGNLTITNEFGILSKESAAIKLKSVKYNNANCYECNDVSRKLDFHFCNLRKIADLWNTDLKSVLFVKLPGKPRMFFAPPAPIFTRYLN